MDFTIQRGNARASRGARGGGPDPAALHRRQGCGQNPLPTVNRDRWCFPSSAGGPGRDRTRLAGAMASRVARHPPLERAQYMHKAAAVARRRIYEMAALQTLEVGKPWEQATATWARASTSRILAACPPQRAPGAWAAAGG
ncbi:MAG: aldehyde dehydrogenase family protein [Bilophila wadsworthia]